MVTTELFVCYFANAMSDSDAQIRNQWLIYNIVVIWWNQIKLSYLCFFFKGINYCKQRCLPVTCVAYGWNPAISCWSYAPDHSYYDNNFYLGSSAGGALVFMFMFMFFSSWQSTEQHLLWTGIRLQAKSPGKFFKSSGGCLGVSWCHSSLQRQRWSKGTQSDSFLFQLFLWSEDGEEDDDEEGDDKYFAYFLAEMRRNVEMLLTTFFWRKVPKGSETKVAQYF